MRRRNGANHNAEFVTFDKYTFENVQSSVLVQTKGIINVKLTGNAFKNIPIKRFAVLWREKNNYYKDNSLTNSKIIKV